MLEKGGFSIKLMHVSAFSFLLLFQAENHNSINKP